MVVYLLYTVVTMRTVVGISHIMTVMFTLRHLPNGYDYMGKWYLVMDFSSVSDQSARVSHVR